MKQNKGFNLISVIFIIIVVSIISGITTGVIISNSFHGNLAGDEALNEFLDVYSDVVSNYYEDVDTKEMLDKAMDAMLDYLDDSYTTYLDEEDSKALQERLKGSYKGIGISITGNQIVEVTEGGPAEKAGLKKDDLIKMVNGTDVTSYSSDQIASLIKDSDQKISLVIMRGEEEKNFDVEIETLDYSEVSYMMVPDTTIGYISIPIFSEKLSKHVDKAVKSLTESGANKLIIDLRNDTGGYLEEAYNVASLFLKKGKLIYSLEDKKGKTSYYDQTEATTNMPIVVLINANSASAAEILTAALKDSYGATLVGKKSFGKGKVQQTYSLEEGSMAKFTSAKWYRPNGTCIDGEGINPDYDVDIEITYDENGNATGAIDKQYEKAIEVLTNMN